MGTQTVNLGLAKPAAGETHWATSLNANWDTLDAMAYVSTPLSWNMLTTKPDTVGQGTWAAAQGSTRLYGGDFSNTTTTDGDNFTCNFRCPAGTYTLRFNAIKYSDAGIVKVYIDGNQVGTGSGYDEYAASLDAVNIVEISGLSLTAGEHTLKFQLSGKNASASSYRFRTSGIWLQRTA
ncbi:MAG TPA: hypothetical protein PK280_12425 [Planctomycetota bacterium]|nr:hypothetical protein [Planctomycetota bacterium]